MKRVVRLATVGSVVVSVARDFSDINGLWERTTDERSGTWYANLKRERRGGISASATNRQSAPPADQVHVAPTTSRRPFSSRISVPTSSAFASFEPGESPATR